MPPLKFQSLEGQVITIDSPDGSMPTEQELDQLFTMAKTNQPGVNQPEPIKTSILSQLKESFQKTGTGLVRGIAEPIIKNVIGRPMLALESLISRQPPVAFNYPFPKSLGGDIPITPIQSLSQAVGAGAQTAALALSPGLGGLLYGGGGAMEEGKSPGEITLSALLMGSLGKVGGMAIGGEPLLTGKIGKLAKTKIAPILKESATRSYRKVLGKTTTKTEKITAEKLTSQLVNRKPFVWTRSGLKDVAEVKSDIYGNQIDDAWSKLSPNQKVSIKPIVKSINDAQKELEVNGIIIRQNEIEHQALQKMKMDLVNIAENPNKIFPQTLRTYRQQLDKFTAARKKGFSVSDADSAVLAATKTMANSVRSEIAKQYPDIAKLNKEFNFWNDMYGLLNNTIQKQKSILPKGHIFMTEHLGRIPYIGIFIRNLGSLVSDNVAWNSLSGSMKLRLSNFLSKGDIKGANLTIMGIMKQLGKTQ